MAPPAFGSSGPRGGVRRRGLVSKEETMGATPTGSILITLLDGTRQALSSGVKR